MRLKILIFFLAITVLAGNFVFAPKKAEAQFVVSAPVVETIESSSLIKDIGQWIKEDLLKALRDKAAKRVIDSIVKDTARWIENGGSPRFVTDWEKFAKDAGNKAAGDVIEETLPFVCSPFKAQLQFALYPTYLYEDAVTCTLDRAIENIEAFYEDFSQGGWVGYSRMWDYNNNFYGTYILAANEMTSRSRTAKEAAVNEAVSGGSFLSVKKEGECLEYESLDDIRNNCSKQFSDDSPEYKSCVENQWGRAVCIKKAPDTIETPGDTVGKAAAQIITSDTEWANNIESWTSVLVNAALNRVTKEGVGLLRSGTQDLFGEDDDAENITGKNTASENKDMMSDLQQFVDFDWDYIITLKDESLALTELRFDIATSIQAIADTSTIEGCVLPFGYQYRPRSIETQIQRLEKQLQDLQENIDVNIAEANKLIGKIKLAVNPAERLAIKQEYSDFMRENNITSIDSYVITAEQEWKDAKAAFDEVNKYYKDECHVNFVFTPEYKERLNIR